MGALLDAARARKAEEQQQRAKQSSAPVDMSKMQGPRIPPLVGYKADTQIVQGMKELNRSFTPQIYKDVVEAAQQKPVNFADYPKRFENLDKKPLYELMKNPVLSNIPAKSNAEKIREFTGIDKPLYELMRNPQLFQSEVQNKQLTWQEKLQNAVQGQSAEFKPALAANLQAIADENSKPKGFFSNIGAAMRSGGRSLEKGFAGTMGGITDAIHQAFGAPNETSISAYLKDDIKVLEKIQSEQPELMEDINKYFEQTKNGGRVNPLLHLKVMSKMHPADFAKIVTMAQMRNPLFYLEDSDNQKAQAKGQTALYLQQRQIPQKDEEYSVQKDTAPQWQQSAMSVAEQVPTQAVNIGAGLLGGGAGGGIAAGINAMGNGYIEAQERENNPLKSLGVGAAKGVLEGATSAIPIGELAGGMKVLAEGGVKGGISSTLKSIGKQVLTQELEENVQEQLSLFGGKVVDQIAYGDGGWDTYGQETWQTAKDTTISTLFFSGVSLGGSAAYGKINPIAKAQLKKGIDAVEQKVKNGTLTKQNFESDPDVQAVARLAKTGLENAAQSGKLNDIVTESGAKYSAMDTEGKKTSAQTVNVDAEGHTPQMRQIMREYANAVDPDVAAFAQYAIANPNDNKTAVQLNDVTQRQAADVKNLTGIDVDGFGAEAKANAFRHINKEHGANGTTDQSMADINDVARVQYVIDNYDNMELLPDESKEFRDTQQKMAPMIRMSKRVNGNYYVVEAVPDTKKKKLEIVSAYKNKAVEQQALIMQAENTAAPVDVRNVVTDTTLTDPIVTQDNNGVNSQSMQNGENYAGKSGFDAFEAGERERVSKALGRSVTSPVYAQTEPVTRQQKRLVKDLKAVGVDAVFFENASTLLDGTDLDINGAYKDGTVYINVNAENPYRAVVGHELTHRLKQADAELYQKIEDIVAGNMDGDTFAKLAENVREEKVADIIGDIMENPRNYREILNQNPSLIQRILDTIKEWLGKIAGKDNLVIGERSELMQYMQKSQSELVALMKEGVGRKPVQFGKQADAKYSPIRKDNNGGYYVEVDGDILDGVPEKEQAAVVKNAMKEKFGTPIKTDNGDVNINRTSRNEYTYSNYTRNLNNAIRVDKFRMANNLDEIIQTQKNVRSESPKHNRNDSIVSFERGNVDVKVGENKYAADVIVGVTKSGQKVFYDLINLNTNTSEKIQHLHQAASENAPTDYTNAVSNNTTIPQRESVVKDIIRRNLENNSGNDTKHSMKTSKLYENTLNKPFVTEEARKTVETNKDRFMYEGITNKETYAKGKMEIETFGADKVRERLYGKDKWKADDVAAGLAAFAEYQSRGETEKAVGLAAVLRRKMTEAGQAVQALQIVNKMTPEGKLMNFLSEAEEMTSNAIEKNGRRAQIEEDLSKALTPKAKQEVLDRYKIPYVDDETTRIVSENLKLIETLNNKKDLIDIIKKQSDMRGTIAKVKSLEKTDFIFLKDVASQQVLGFVADKIPVGTAKKLSTYQAMSHLLNARTMGRNIISNAAFDVVDAAANNIAFGFDALMGAFTKKNTVGFDRGWLEKGRLKAANDRGRKSKIGIQLGVDISGGSKYELNNKRTFQNKGIGKALNAAERGMNYGLQTTDEWNKGAITHSSAEALKRRKNIAFDDAEIMELARREARYRTFQDDNMMSDALRGIKDTLNRAGFGEKKNGVYAFGLGDLTQKYTQVPGALIMRSVEYSPIGYAKMLGTIIDAAKQRSFTPQHQRQLALTLGRATTGTGLIYLFKCLSNMGIFTGEQDDKDKKLNALQSGEGLGSMQINLSALNRLITGKDPKRQSGDILESIGFLEPLNTLMAMGYDISKSEGGITDWKSMLESKTFEQIVDIPTMQTAQSIMQGIQYGQAPMEIVIGVGVDSATGFVPSVMRQSANFFDPVQRNIYNEETKEAQSLARLKSTIPGLKNTLNPRVTPFGEEKTNSTGNAAGDFFNAFLNPGSATRYQPSEISEELYRMGGIYGEGVLPKATPKKFSSDGEEYKMFGKEYADFAKLYGKSADAALKAVINSDIYKNADDDGKSEYLEKAISAADKSAKEIMQEYYKNGGALNPNTNGEGYMKQIQKGVIQSHLNDLQAEVKKAYEDSDYFVKGKSYSDAGAFKRSAAYQKYIRESKKLKTELKKLGA